MEADPAIHLGLLLQSQSTRAVDLHHQIRMLGMMQDCGVIATAQRAPGAGELHNPDWIMGIRAMDLQLRQQLVINALQQLLHTRDRTGIGHGRIVAGLANACKQIGSYAHAQELLRQGHTYLDSNIRRYGNRTIRQPPPRARRRTLNLRGGPVANPSLTLQKSPARLIGAGATAEVKLDKPTSVNALARRERQPVAAKSHTPFLFPMC
jgi:hypothetical protein